MSLLILTLLRTDLIEEWQAQLPANTPNHFMMNITQNQIEGIENFFAENGIQGNQFYPLISARVSRINGDLPDPGDASQVSIGQGTLTENAQLGDVEFDEEVEEAINAPQTDAPPVNEGEATTGGRRVRGNLSRRQVTWTEYIPNDNLIRKVPGGGPNRSRVTSQSKKNMQDG